MVFLFFDESYTKIALQKGEQLREVDFEEQYYQEIRNAFQEKSIKPQIITYRFTPQENALFLPQTLNLSNPCKEEIEIRSMPLFLYDEMLPVF